MHVLKMSWFSTKHPPAVEKLGVRRCKEKHRLLDALLVPQDFLVRQLAALFCFCQNQLTFYKFILCNVDKETNNSAYFWDCALVLLVPFVLFCFFILKIFSWCYKQSAAVNKTATRDWNFIYWTALSTAFHCASASRALTVTPCSFTITGSIRCFKTCTKQRLHCGKLLSVSNFGGTDSLFVSASEETQSCALQSPPTALFSVFSLPAPSFRIGAGVGGVSRCR